tara:strand:- start:2754 stop:3800 length:1047 start_codon:yes stop_codon:yes gene_type:complete
MSFLNARKSVVATTLFLCLFVIGCGGARTPAEDTVAFEGGIMGTIYHISLVATLSDELATSTAALIETTLKRVDGKMSTYKDDSELSELNTSPAAVPVTLSEETFSVLKLALEVNKQTDGAFDITVGPLVNAWGFGPDAFLNPPTEDVLATLHALVGPDKITLDESNHAVTKLADGVYCDLSGIAKGYAVDAVAQALSAEGLDRFMVEVGGEVRTSGLNSAGVPWNIAIEKPVSEGRVLQEIVGLRDIALATSGDYRNFYEVDGKRVAHTIDPVTSKPVAHSAASVSVLHPQCALADAYATAMMVLGPEKGLAIAERLQLPVMFLLHGEDGSITTRQTESFKDYVVVR